MSESCNSWELELLIEKLREDSPSDSSFKLSDKMFSVLRERQGRKLLTNNKCQLFVYEWLSPDK